MRNKIIFRYDHTEAEAVQYLLKVRSLLDSVSETVCSG